MTNPGITVVVPVFGDGAALPELVRRTIATLTEAGETWEIILVNDGSPAPTWDRIMALAATQPAVRGIDLARNFGQHNALLAGIRASTGKVVVTIDDDLQHPPEEIPALLAPLRDTADLVYGVPRNPEHERWRNTTSFLGKAIIGTVLGVATASQISAFRAFRGKLRFAFRDYQSPDVSIDVLLSWGAARVTSVSVRHDAGKLGGSRYTFRRLVRHWLNMVTGFSTWPLRVASLVGFVFTLFGFAVLVWVLGRYFLQGTSVPGFPFLACLIAIFSGVQLFSLGVIGEYVARVFVRQLDRPPFVVEATVNFDDD